jgi:hypothetical protein
MLQSPHPAHHPHPATRGVLVFEIRFPHLFDAPLVIQKRKMEIHSEAENLSI